MTDLCVETTARQAFMSGFQPVVVSDATASKNEELHLAALKTLAHGFAHIVEARYITELIR
jgi:isochorismate hydrolase